MNKMDRKLSNKIENYYCDLVDYFLKIIKFFNYWQLIIINFLIEKFILIEYIINILQYM